MTTQTWEETAEPLRERLRAMENRRDELMARRQQYQFTEVGALAGRWEDHLDDEIAKLGRAIANWDRVIEDFKRRLPKPQASGH
jgi:hypothetical protein